MTPAQLGQLLDRRDAEISRCRRCGEWRWRAWSTPCQTCDELREGVRNVG